MPFTPFHFGPALLLKSATPRRFSFVAFVASQVVIDIESFYWLVQDAWPVHRVLHTFVGGAVVGVVVAVGVLGLARTPVGVRLAQRWGLAGDVEVLPVFVGSLVGGLSHSVLDGIMHADIQPFRPFFDENPLLGSLDVGLLHLACAATGLLGLGVLVVRRLRRRRAQQ